jgi:hypothetical protein
MFSPNGTIPSPNNDFLSLNGFEKFSFNAGNSYYSNLKFLIPPENSHKMKKAPRLLFMRPFYKLSDSLNSVRLPALACAN